MTDNSTRPRAGSTTTEHEPAPPAGRARATREATAGAAARSTPSTGAASPPDPRRTLGAQGERHACAYLASLGYEILETNWRCSEGEIDVVARDGREIVVVEVKTRRSQRFGPAVEAVTHEKHLRLRRLACLWLREREVSAAAVRIDVIGVDVLATGVRVDHRRRVIL